MMPTGRPVSFCRAQVPFLPQMKREYGLYLKRVLRRTVRIRVSESNRVLRNEPYQQSGNTAVYDPECGTCLPRALAGAPRRRCRKDEGRPNTDEQPGFLPVWPWQHSEVKKCHVAEFRAGSP